MRINKTIAIAGGIVFVFALLICGGIYYDNIRSKNRILVELARDAYLAPIPPPNGTLIFVGDTSWFLTPTKNVVRFRAPKDDILTWVRQSQILGDSVAADLLSKGFFKSSKWSPDAAKIYAIDINLQKETVEIKVTYN